MIRFVVSVKFNNCSGGALQRLTVLATSLDQLRERLKRIAAEQGGEFATIYLFHDIVLLTNDQIDEMVQRQINENVTEMVFRNTHPHLQPKE